MRYDRIAPKFTSIARCTGGFAHPLHREPPSAQDLRPRATAVDVEAVSRSYLPTPNIQLSWIPRDSRALFLYVAGASQGICCPLSVVRRTIT